MKGLFDAEKYKLRWFTNFICCHAILQRAAAQHALHSFFVLFDFRAICLWHAGGIKSTKSGLFIGILRDVLEEQAKGIHKQGQLWEICMQSTLPSDRKTHAVGCETG